jgi:hypothetical protein
MGCSQDGQLDWQFDPWLSGFGGMSGRPPEMVQCQAGGTPLDKGFRSNTPLLDSLPPASGRCTADTLLGLAAADANPALLGGVDGDCAFHLKATDDCQL